MERTAHEAAPVTVIGLGAMGATLARTFLDAGHPTTVWNRTPQRADALVADGAVLAPSVSAAVKASPLVIVNVLDLEAVRAVLDPLGEELEGRAIVNLTSSTPEAARELGAWLGSRGVAYVDGAIMVPTPMIGTADSLVLYSGAQEVFETHRATLERLGGTADYLGEDAGLASLYDLGMLDLYFAGMAGYLHAAALVGADGVDAKTFLPYAEQMVAVLGASLPDLARNVDTGTHPGDEDTLDMELAAVDHIVHASEARGVTTEVPEVVRTLVRNAIAQGHGRDSFSRVVELMR